MTVDDATGYDTRTGCFPSNGGFVLANGAGTTYFGAGDALTNDQGLYRVGALMPGSYRVDASIDGFEPAARTVVASALRR